MQQRSLTPDTRGSGALPGPVGTRRKVSADVRCNRRQRADQRLHRTPWPSFNSIPTPDSHLDSHHLGNLKSASELR
jgi:hypothetical protein